MQIGTTPQILTAGTHRAQILSQELYQYCKTTVIIYEKGGPRIYQSAKNPLETISILAYPHFQLLGEDFTKEKVFNRLQEALTQEHKYCLGREDISASCN